MLMQHNSHSFFLEAMQLILICFMFATPVTRNQGHNKNAKICCAHQIENTETRKDYLQLRFFVRRRNVLPPGIE